MHQPRSFLQTACGGWVLSKRLRKASKLYITKVQRAARQKPYSKRSVSKRLKQTVSTVETSQQQADQVRGVEGKPKQQRLTWRQVYNEQSDSRCWDKTRMTRVTCGVEQHKALKIETETRLQQVEWLKVLSKPNQSNKDWDGDNSTTSRATQGPKQPRVRQKQVNND